MIVVLFFCAFGSVGVALWWLTQQLPQSPRETAAFGLAIVVALCLKLGMALEQHYGHD